MKKTPYAAIVITALALAVYLCPGARDVCIFDRAAILRGEWWRLITGHLVHFSPSHLLFDLTVFVLAGGLVEARSRHLFWALLASATMLIALALLAFVPELRFYGGLSGIATAMLFLIALNYAGQIGPLRWCGIVVVLGTVTKFCIEVFSHQPLFAQFDSPTVRLVTLAHGMGMVAAALAWWATRAAHTPAAPQNQVSPVPSQPG
jgi:rhomboid family GlyGly-CTERM serine protease